MVPLMNDRKKIHPDVQTVVIHITPDKLNPVGIIDQRLKTRTPFDNIFKTHTVTIGTFILHNMNIAQPFYARIT